MLWDMDISYQCKEILKIQVSMPRIVCWVLLHQCSRYICGYATQATRMSLLNLHTSCSFLTVLAPWDYCRTRAWISRADQYYASYPAGTEFLTETAKVWIWILVRTVCTLFICQGLLMGVLTKAALGNCFEIDDWSPIEFFITTKHFDWQGKLPYVYHAVSCFPLLFHLVCPILDLAFIWKITYVPAYTNVVSCYICIYLLSAIYGTAPLPWAAWWKQLNSWRVLVGTWKVVLVTAL